MEATLRLPILAIALFLCAPGVTRAQDACPTPWQLEEVLRIGSLESEDLVTGVLDLAIGPDSALYVAQALVPTITVFSLDGRVLRRIGRAGQGPGDFELAATNVGWIGDTLWVADRYRVQLFTTNEFVPEEIIRFNLSVPDEGGFLTPQRVLADGTLIGRRTFVGGLGPWLSRGADPGLALRRLSRSGEILDTIAIIHWPDNALEYENDRGQRVSQIHPLRDLPSPGLREYFTALKPDGSAVVQIVNVREDGIPPVFDLLVISIGGDTLLHRAIEYEPREVTSAMERRLADEAAGWVVGDYNPTASGWLVISETTLERRRRAVRSAFRVPEHLPPVRQVVAGTDGTIWLLRELREDRVDVWEIRDAEGELEGTVEIAHGRGSIKPWSPRLAIGLASRDEVWGTTYDEYDVPYIHRYRVDRTCASPGMQSTGLGPRELWPGENLLRSDK